MFEITNIYDLKTATMIDANNSFVNSRCYLNSESICGSQKKLELNLPYNMIIKIFKFFVSLKR